MFWIQSGETEGYVGTIGWRWMLYQRTKVHGVPNPLNSAEFCPTRQSFDFCDDHDSAFCILQGMGGLYAGRLVTKAFNIK